VGAIRIEEGRYGDVPLDGLKAAFIFQWPGPVHEGRGKCQAIVDERADERQREALLRILSGEDSEPGKTSFYVYASTMEEAFPPIFAPIAFDVDVDARRGRIRVEGLIEVEGEPIRNPVTGNEHRARIDLPGRLRIHAGRDRQRLSSQGEPDQAAAGEQLRPVRAAAHEQFRPHPRQGGLSRALGGGGNRHVAAPQPADRRRRSPRPDAARLVPRGVRCRHGHERAAHDGLGEFPQHIIRHTLKPPAEVADEGLGEGRSGNQQADQQ
jgi:hypothetical protein